MSQKQEPQSVKIHHYPIIKKYKCVWTGNTGEGQTTTHMVCGKTPQTIT